MSLDVFKIALICAAILIAGIWATGCSYLLIAKDCSQVQPNDSIGDNKFVCRQIKPWE